MKRFWKNANFRLKAGIIMTAFFLFLGFVVYYFPHVDPFTYNTYRGKLPPSLEHPRVPLAWDKMSFGY